MDIASLQRNYFQTFKGVKEIATGLKTVTTTGAELFAGASPLSRRVRMLVYNAGQDNVYWGNGAITASTGFPLLPGDSIVFTFEPTKEVPVYFISEGSVPVRVGETA